MTNAELIDAVVKGAEEGAAFQFGSTRGYDMPLYTCYGISLNNELLAACYNDDKGRKVWLIDFGRANKYATRIARQIENVAVKHNYAVIIYYDTAVFNHNLRTKFGMRIWQ